MTFAEKLRNHPLYKFPDFRNFFIGDVLVAIAERYFAITFAWWLISQDGDNGKWLGILMAVEALPILFLSPFVGPLIDRYNKKKSMLMGVLMQLFFVSIICYLLYMDKLPFAMLCLLSFLMSCFVPQFEDSVSASVSRLVDEEHLSAATAIQSSSIEFSNIFAAVISTSVIAAFSVLTAVYVNIGLYIVGAIFLYLIKTDLSPGEKPEDHEGDYIKELKEGVRYILGNKAMISYSLIYAFETFLIVPIFILIPMLVKNVLNETVNWVAVFEIALSIGAVSMALLMSFRERYRNFYNKYATGIFLIGLSMLGLAFILNEYIMAVIIFLVGALFAALMALSFMMFQHVVPDDLKGRFFGIISTIAAGMAPLSYMYVGFMSDVLSIEAVLVINGLGALLLAGVILVVPRLKQHIGYDEVEDEGIRG